MPLLHFDPSNVRLNLPPGGEIKVFVDGAHIDTLQLPKEIEEGDHFGSVNITEALGVREIKSVHTVGTMVMITTVED